MKTKITLILILLSSLIPYTSCAHAQARISSVYGVNLGDSESVVTSKISGVWRTNPKKGRFYLVKRPMLGDCSFKSGSFWFKDGKLSEVIFIDYDNGGIDTETQANGYDEFLEGAERCKNTYDAIYGNLTDKYGRPSSESKYRAVWRSNGNMIKIQYKFRDNIMIGTLHDCDAEVSVTYSVGSSSSSNY